MMASGEVVDTRDRHVRGEEEEARRDRLLSPPFGRRRCAAPAGEEPDDHSSGEQLDG